MKESNDLNSFLGSLERNELNEEQQILLSSYGGGPDLSITISGNNILSGCHTNNCSGGNCGNCVTGCGGK